MLKIAPLLGLAAPSEIGLQLTQLVATRLADRFDYVSDPERLGMPDNWPTRDEVGEIIRANHGRLVGDCDDFAFAAAYVLHDLYIPARVVLGACETGGGHMVCEDHYGYVIDKPLPRLAHDVGRARAHRLTAARG